LKATNFAQYSFFIVPQIVLDFIPLGWVIWNLPCSNLVLSRSNGLFGSNVWLSVLVQVHCQRYNLGETPPL